MKEKHDYYVYIHKDKVTGEVFYVGKGRGKRYDSKHGRTQKWVERASVNGYVVELLRTELTECKAVELENTYLASNLENWKLVNVHKDYDTHSLDFEVLSEYFCYDESSPTCLRWKKWNGQANHSRRDVGDVAGFVNKNGSYTRYKVSLHGKGMMVHRVVMILNGFELDKRQVINHIDTNPCNNKISNLEVVTKSENNRRTKMQVGIGLNSRNKSGVNGVHEHIYTRADGTVHYYAYAQWKHGDKCKYKVVPYSEHGKDAAWELAIRVREEALKEIYKMEMENDVC